MNALRRLPALRRSSIGRASSITAFAALTTASLRPTAFAALTTASLRPTAFAALTTANQQPAPGCARGVLRDLRSQTAFAALTTAGLRPIERPVAEGTTCGRLVRPADDDCIRCAHNGRPAAEGTSCGRDYGLRPRVRPSADSAGELCFVLRPELAETTRHITHLAVNSEMQKTPATRMVAGFAAVNTTVNTVNSLEIHRETCEN